jgi:hypothetical protein
MGIRCSIQAMRSASGAMVGVSLTAAVGFLIAALQSPPPDDAKPLWIGVAVAVSLGTLGAILWLYLGRAKPRPKISRVEDASLPDTQTDGPMWRVRVHNGGSPGEIRAIRVPEYGDKYAIPWRPGGQRREWEWLAPDTPLTLDIARATKMAGVWFASDPTPTKPSPPSPYLDLFSVSAGTFPHAESDPWPIAGILHIEDREGTLWSGQMVLDYTEEGHPIVRLAPPTGQRNSEHLQ